MALALSTEKRAPLFAAVPTVAETVPGFVMTGWIGYFAPAGTPRPIVERLNAALRQALADGRVRKTFDEGGMDVFAADQQTPEAAGALLKRELKLWAEVIRANNIAAQ